MKKLLFTAMLLLTQVVCAKQVSPNGKLELSYDSSAKVFTLNYSGGLGLKKIVAIPAIGVKTSDGRGDALALASVSGRKKVKDNYTMVTGKRSECSNEANEYTYRFTDGKGENVRMVFRLYDDGLAFRYELDAMQGASVIDELTTFRLDEDVRCWVQDYDWGYERFYLPREINGGNKHWGYPALVEYGNGVWALLSEANILKGHAASSLKSESVPTDFKVALAENDGAGIDGDWVSPWRVMIVGSLADVVESTLITDVCEESKIADADEWVKPACASWVYWAYNHGSKDFQIVKKYINMAETLSIPYVLIDWEWDVMGNGGNIDDAIRMATEKGVKTLVWYNSSTAWVDGAAGPLYRLNKPEDREKEFAWLKSKGVSGVKIDFFAGDSRATMDYCIDLLESAARHGLLVNFHGATIPRGWQRTYPNLMTVEAVYGAEWYNNNGTLTNKAAGHNATLPFTRNVVGSMDYTPCAFSDSQHPHITTHAHELALTVLFESGIQHLADRPESFLAQPQDVQSFITGLPSAWDDTKLVSGYPSSHAVIARQKDDTWYVGAVNGLNSAQEITADLSFLPKGRYNVKVFADSGDKSNPWKIETYENVKPSDMPFVSMETQPRGGYVIVAEKQ